MNATILKADADPTQPYANHLYRELADIMKRVGQGQTGSFSAEEAILSDLFETGYAIDFGDEKELEEVRTILRKFSLDFPEALISLDVSLMLAIADDEDKSVSVVTLQQREYFIEGLRQIAYPEMVVPDFDPMGMVD